MKGKIRVLWIEDSARFDLPQMAAPVYMDGGYDLVVAEEVTRALVHLRNSEFAAVIVDIRIPPGTDQGWIDVYQQAGHDKMGARLGLKLLRSMLGSARAEVVWSDRPQWITADKIGVLTVEGWSEVESELMELGIRSAAYRQKRADVPDTVLLELIQEVLSHSQAS